MAGLIIAAIVAVTQAPPTTTAGPQDIIVTGERSGQPARISASSLVVRTSADLAVRPAFDRVDQLLAEIPNVQMGSQGTGPTIRGQDTTGALRDLSAFLGGNRPRTTLVVDGRAVSYNEFVFGSQSLWDVARVEIYRTPQSTTQGRNSIAGAIFVTTEDPLRITQATGRIIAGNARTGQLSATLNMPLTDDLAVRISTDWRNSRTSSELEDANRPLLDLNQVRTRLLRLKLRATPAFLPGTSLLVTFTHSQAAMPQVEGLRAPFRQRRDPFATYGYFTSLSSAIIGQAQVLLTSDINLDLIASSGWARANRSAPPGLGVADNISRDLNGEAILHWRPAGRTRVTAGISLQRQRLRQTIDLSRILGQGRFRDVQESVGLFGEATFDLSSSLSASIGVRWQHDKQDRKGLLNGESRIAPLDYHARSDFLLPRLALTYMIRPSTTVGILIQRASNPGGTTISLNGPLVFAPETLWNTELFARSDLLSSKLQISMNLFKTRFRDAQRAIPRLFRLPSSGVVTFADIVNVPRARSSGLEASADWKVRPNLALHLSAAYLATRLFPQPGQPLQRDFQRAPRWSAQAGAEWRPAPRLTISAQARARAAYFSDDFNSPALRVGGGWLVDARGEWDSGSVQIFAYARNLTNRFLLTTYITPELATAENPREAGVGAGLSF